MRFHIALYGLLLLPGMVLGASDDVMSPVSNKERQVICKGLFPTADTDCYVGKINLSDHGRPVHVVALPDFVFLLRIESLQPFAAHEIGVLRLPDNNRCDRGGPTTCVYHAQRIPSARPQTYDLLIRASNGCGIFYWQNTPSQRPQNGEPRAMAVRINCEQSTLSVVQELANCRTAGGKLEVSGLLGFGICVRPTSDGGQPCNDDSQCEIACVAPRDAAPHQTGVTGFCASINRPGCGAQVRAGKTYRPPCE